MVARLGPLCDCFSPNYCLCVPRCGDYFTTTAGVGMSLAGNPTILSAAQDLFYRDWNSEYTVPLPQGPFKAL